MTNPLVLASASVARARLLRAAGVEFAVEPADIDEVAIKQHQRQAGVGVIDCAAALVIAKAGQVSTRHPDALAIEGDQFAIQGLPLVELFDYLRVSGALRA